MKLQLNLKSTYSIRETMEFSHLGISRTRTLSFCIDFGKSILIYQVRLHEACQNFMLLSCLGCLLSILLIFGSLHAKFKKRNPRKNKSYILQTPLSRSKEISYRLEWIIQPCLLCLYCQVKQSQDFSTHTLRIQNPPEFERTFHCEVKTISVYGHTQENRKVLAGSTFLYMESLKFLISNYSD